MHYTFQIYTHSSISYLNPIHHNFQRKQKKNVNLIKTKKPMEMRKRVKKICEKANKKVLDVGKKTPTYKWRDVVLVLNIIHLS